VQSFFTLFALVLIGVKDQREQRDGWHHGGWMVKLCLWALLTLLAFLAPNSLIGAYGESEYSLHTAVLRSSYSSDIDLAFGGYVPIPACRRRERTLLAPASIQRIMRL
jgi:hypothetical protein